MTHWNYSTCYWTEFARLRREGCESEQARVGALALADAEMMGLISNDRDFSIMGFNSRRKTRTYYSLHFDTVREVRRIEIRRQLENGPFLAAFLAFDSDTPTLPEYQS